MGASGALNSLGRPDIDFWSLYVREALQNCWDARAGEGPVGVTFEVRGLNDDQHAFFTDEVIGSLPPDGSETWDALLSDRTVVTVADYGTSGMGGPTRADVADPTVHDFADFVWNIGQPPDKRHGGGTYGYGKSVHYLASGAHAILVYTSCLVGGTPESRLILCAWGREFSGEVEDRQVPFTGRHWWGMAPRARDLPVAPLTGEYADRVAGALGIGPFPGGTGTCVMALAAAVDDRAEWGRTVADAVVWHCWPKLVGGDNGSEMLVAVRVDGEAVPVTAPEEHPEVSVLAECLRSVRTSEEGAELVETIRLQRPAIVTGTLALKRHMVREAEPSPARPFEGPLRHVALMRAPLLVVEYMEGPEPPAPFAGWAGVFVADPEHDRAFALSEPPAHDAWIPKGVEDKNLRRVVNVTLRRLSEVVRRFTSPRPPATDGEGVGLGALADRLGDLLPVGGVGPVVPPRGGGGGNTEGSVRRSRASVTGHELEMADGDLILVARVLVQLRSVVREASLFMEVGVATNDGAGVETSTPAGASVPRVLRWVDSTGTAHDGEAVTVTGPDEAVWQAHVSLPPDAAVTLSPRLQETELA
jgi:hypothetical protein